MSNNNSLVLFFLIIFLSKFLFAQSAQQERLIYLPQGFIQERLSGGHYLGATQSSVMQINAGNPAASNDISGFSMGISYQSNSKIADAWIANFGYSQNKVYYPQSISLSFKFDEFVIGIGSNQIYNSTIDYGKIKATKVADNELGYEEIGVFRLKMAENVIKNSVLVSYNFKNLLNLSHNMIFGIQYNLNNLQSSFLIDSDEDVEKLKYPPLNEWNTKISRSNISIGLRYDFLNQNIPVFMLGVFYESQLIFSKYGKTNNSRTFFIGYIPDKIHAGILLNLKNGIYASMNVSYYLWESVDYGLNNYLNQLELNGNISYKMFNNITSSIGLLRTDRKYSLTDDILKQNSSLYAIFMTLGLVYKYKNYEIAFSFADSHLFSDDWRKQSIAKIGIGYSVN